MMKKYSVPTLMCLTLLTVFTNIQAQVKKAYSASVKKSPNGYTLSINVHNLPLEKLLERLISQFPLRVTTYGVDTSQPITINFKEMPLEQGIKRLLKESGINNHFIQYGNDGNSRSPITVLTLLGNGTKSDRKTITEETTEKSKERESLTLPSRESDSPEDQFTEKITALKKRYEWADKETEELAGYLLELMPKPVRGKGMEVLMNELDWILAAEKNDAVDEEIFFQALENIVPSHLAPVMMDSIEQYNHRYKTGSLPEMGEQSPNELYQNVMSKRLSNRNNNLQGVNSYDHENH